MTRTRNWAISVNIFRYKKKWYCFVVVINIHIHEYVHLPNHHTMFPLTILIVYSSAIFSYTYIWTFHIWLPAWATYKPQQSCVLCLKVPLQLLPLLPAVKYPLTQAHSLVHFRAFTINRHKHHVHTFILGTILHKKSFSFFTFSTLKMYINYLA